MLGINKNRQSKKIEENLENVQITYFELRGHSFCQTLQKSCTLLYHRAVILPTPYTPPAPVPPCASSARQFGRMQEAKYLLPGTAHVENSFAGTLARRKLAREVQCITSHARPRSKMASRVKPSARMIRLHFIRSTILIYAARWRTTRCPPGLRNAWGLQGGLHAVDIVASPNSKLLHVAYRVSGTGKPRH